MNFWKQLKKPTFILAPMDGVTDTVFRQLISSIGKPDVFFTEFVPVDALLSKGKEKAIKTLTYLESERPVVAQIWGSDPDKFYQVAKLLSQMKFDGIDINMGCPDRNVEKQTAGSALIKNPKLASQVIQVAKKSKLPISVKTRIGYNKDEIAKWIPVILQENVVALTVHFRARNDGYDLPANWELAKKVVDLRDNISPQTLIIGNGDIKSLGQAKKLAEEYGVDGIMIGRGLLGNPWFFAGREPSIAERLGAIAEHAEFFSADKHFDNIKKHFHAYCKNFAGAKELREQLMKTKNAKEVKGIINNFSLEFMHKKV